MSARRRLAFGRVAELYDRARPSYPPVVIDRVIEVAALAPPMRIADVGAGTGKATVLFAERGLSVLALEPSPEMVRVARVNCAPYPDVEVLETDFESWRPRERLPALVSAQAWHWTVPGTRYQLAHRALGPGGTLAVIWTFPDWRRCPSRRALSEAYRAHAPGLAADFPMHPDSEPTRLAGDWPAEIAASGRFAAARVEPFAWSQAYTGHGYTQLLRTHQDHILLEAGPRDELLTAIGRAVDSGGGTLDLPFVTRLCLATRD